MQQNTKYRNAATSGKYFICAYIDDVHIASGSADECAARVDRYASLEMYNGLTPPAARLVGIHTNPGPPDAPPITLTPSSRRPPRHIFTVHDDSAFLPRPATQRDLPRASEPASIILPCPLTRQNLPRAAELDVSAILLSYRPKDMPELLSDSCSECSDCDHPFAAVLPSISSNSSVTSDPDIHDTICLVDEPPDLLPPPKFIGFLCAPHTRAPPAEHTATICAVDSMCLGPYSVISQEIVTSLNLPTKPFSKTSRTASGAVVKCSALASFVIIVRVLQQWHSLPCQALVWEHTSQPLLLCNAWALDSGFISMVHPNHERCKTFGTACFSLNWEAEIRRDAEAELICYHEDVMDESDDDIVDLSAPLKVGDQDVSVLPDDAKAYAARFPSMTKALPFHAHPDLEKWRANVVVEDLAKYSWPKCDLQDLKEDKFPAKVLPAIHGEFDKLIQQGFAEEIKECPTSVVMKAQLVAKTKTDRRFCVNGSQQKKVLRVGVWPMPNIRNIFAFVAGFAWRAKIDLKWGYYNFEVHEDDRKWTVTIGGGRAVQWRKLVQGFASSGAFFQYAMTKLLGPSVVGIIAEVYLDDLIIVGHSFEECQRNVDTVMAILHAKNFRVNFSKCQFTPSITISFLGCTLHANVVSPGPKVGTMLAKIQPFYLHSAPKAQRHHLHVFLGMCTYLLNHCPGLKQALHPLYQLVAAEPFRVGDSEKECFRTCHAMLSNLQVYHLPSVSPGYMLEVHSDASGGAGTRLDPGHWGAVLGQRLDVANPIFAEGFELIQLAGGSFNERQAKWDIQRKEMYALYHAIKTFRYFIFARQIRIIIDSKVLMLMHRSSVPMVQRWYAYIQSHDFILIHFASDRNCLADGLTRCVQVLPPTVLPPAARLVGVEPNPGPFTPDAAHVLISSDSSSSVTSDDDAQIIAPVDESPQTPSTIGQRRHRGRPSAHASPPIASPSTSQRAASPANARSQPSSALQETRHVRPETHPLSTRPQPANPLPPWIDMLAPEPAASTTAATAIMVRHVCPESSDSFYFALSHAIQHENDTDRRNGIACVLETPSHGRERCRETIIAWMRANANIPQDCLQGHTPHQRRSEMYDGTPLVLFSSDTSVWQPASWLEYIQLLLANCEADELVLRCAALCYRTQICVTVQHLGTKTFSPPSPVRTVHLLFSPSTRHFNWCHRFEDVCTDEDECDNTDGIQIHFDSVPVTSIGNEGPPPRRHLGTADALTAANRNFILEAHNGFTGHPGISSTVRILHERGHRWRGMTAQVAQFIAQCPTCTLTRVRLTSARAAASTLRLLAPPLRRWHLDSTGPMEPCVHTGFTRLIVAVCESTGYVVVQGSRFGSSLEIVLLLVFLVGTYGLFESFHSDNGPENDAFLLHQFIQVTGIQHTASIPINPQTNGIAERTIQNVKRFLRCMIADGLTRHNGWGLMLPILQQSMNSTACGPLHASPNSIVFASLHAPEAFVIPTTYLDAPQGVNIADGNFYEPSANFVTRAVYFQQLMTNRRHELLMEAMRAAGDSAPIHPDSIPIGTQVLIPWPQGRPPSTLHPFRRGPYVVVSVDGNVLSLVHTALPLPADQISTLRWSRQAQIFTLDSILARDPHDPAAIHSAIGIPSEHSIDCILDYHLLPSFDRSQDAALARFDVRNQVYVCRLYGVPNTMWDVSHWRREFLYEDIRHTLAFDSFIASCPFLEGHIPVASMPANWDPRAPVRSRRPSHGPVIDAERPYPIIQPPAE